MMILNFNGDITNSSNNNTNNVAFPDIKLDLSSSRSMTTTVTLMICDISGCGTIELDNVTVTIT